MGRIRTFAHSLLCFAIRHSPGISHEWAEAMLGELDYIPGEWESLFWALGSIVAIIHQSARQLQAWLLKYPTPQERKMNTATQKTLGVLSGMGLALAFALVLVGVFVLAAQLFPSLGLMHAEWTHLLFNIVLPEIIFIIVAIRLWRTRLPVAAGILLIGFGMAAHVVIHFASR